MAEQRGLAISTKRLLRGATSVSVKYVVSRSKAYEERSLAVCSGRDLEHQLTISS